MKKTNAEHNVQEEIEIDDSQIKLIKSNKRRAFTNKQKISILETFSALETGAERGAFLRKNGLYYANISDWKKAFSEGKLDKDTKKNEHSKRNSSSEIKKLLNENAQLKKKLSQAHAILDLQKKVSELLGIHIDPQNLNEVN
jgi:transposase